MVKTKTNNYITICEVLGNVTMHDALEVAHAIKSATTDMIIVDLTNVPTVDSSLIGAVLKHRNVRKVIIRVCNGSYIHNTLKMMQMEKFVEVKAVNDPHCKKEGDDAENA